jgi:Icc-related predicted phosphoesterase
MKLRIVSDLHSEFWNPNGPKKMESKINTVLPPHQDDAQSVLVMAGDCGSLSRLTHYKWLLDVLSPRFHAIIWVPGNHEWYGGDWVQGQTVFRELLEEYPNVLYNYVNTIEGINILATTLWTDFNRENPVTMEAARNSMPDYRWITNGNRNLTPQDTLLEHKRSKATVERLLGDTYVDVVVTHHAPSLKSISPGFHGDILNGAFVSDLSEIILEFQPKLWIHGHVHTKFDYRIGETRILCNPYGYEGHERPLFDPFLFVDI